jgi:hypothetical protein
MAAVAARIAPAIAIAALPEYIGEIPAFRWLETAAVNSLCYNGKSKSIGDCPGFVWKNNIFARSAKKGDRGAEYVRKRAKKE